MRTSNQKTVKEQGKFKALYPQYKALLDILIDNFKVSDGSYFEQLVNFKTNKTIPKHRWYDYKHGYSQQLVKHILNSEKPSKNNYVLDPFCGVGTTNLTAQTMGYKSIGFDINPMALLATEVKTHYFSSEEILDIETSISNFRLPLKKDEIENSKVVSTSFAPETLDTLLKIKWFIENNKNQFSQKFFRLVLISILDDCSLKIKDGNGLKFKKNVTPLPDLQKYFLDKAKKMLVDIKETNHPEESVSILGSMMIDQYFDMIRNKKIGLCLFSPPYANCFDYCEVYKLEFWLGGFVKKYDDFDKYRSIAMRSHVNSKFDHSILNFNKNVDLIADIISTFNVWNKNIPDMLRGYFDDMSKLLKNLRQVLIKEAKCYIVVANSGYKEILVPTDLLIADIAKNLGYSVNNIFYARKIRSSSQQMQCLNGNYSNLMRESIIEIQSR